MTIALLYDIVVWSLLVLFCWSVMSLLAMAFLSAVFRALPRDDRGNE
jgi:hypothetical protein